MTVCAGEDALAAAAAAAYRIGGRGAGVVRGCGTAEPEEDLEGVATGGGGGTFDEEGVESRLGFFCGDEGTTFAFGVTLSASSFDDFSATTGFSTAFAGVFGIGGTGGAGSSATDTES